MLTMIFTAIIVCLASLVESQKGHYIRPFVDVRLPYRMPVYQEMSFAPRIHKSYYQSHQDQTRERAQSRSQEAEQIVANKQEEEVKPTTPPPKETFYPILSYSNEMTHDGAYSYKYETADGVMREESSIMEVTEDGKSVPKVRGSYSYPSPDGRTIRVEYVADEDGFRANQVAEDSRGTFRRLGSNGFSYSFRAP